MDLFWNILSFVTNYVSRGFGFVTFLDPSCVQKVIDSRPHYLDNKEV